MQNTARRGGIRRRGLPDELVSLEEEGWGNGQAEGLGGFKIDHQLERGGLLHGEVSGLGPLEDLVHVGGRAPIQVMTTRPIGYETPNLGFQA